MVLVQCLTGMEIREFPNISFEHPILGSTFKKYRSRLVYLFQFQPQRLRCYSKIKDTYSIFFLFQLCLEANIHDFKRIIGMNTPVRQVPAIQVIIVFQSIGSGYPIDKSMLFDIVRCNLSWVYKEAIKIELHRLDRRM